MQKYLLVTSIEDKKPDKTALEKWFKSNKLEAKFDPSLFSYFKTTVIDKKKYKEHYYTVSFMKVL